jgi:hydroxyethylthiazole kinase-like uncharacterized protein yjeF
MIPIITPTVMLEEEKVWDIQDPIKRIETSGRALFENLINHIHSQDHLLFIVGKGLNGADALCLAMHCLEAGFEITVMCLYQKSEFKSETSHFYEQLESFNVIKPFHLPKQGRYCLIDGVYGAGFKGPVHADIKALFDQINLSHFYKIAIDIPSGIEGESGEGKSAIECDLTLSIGLPKWGLFVKQGRSHSGHIDHVEIGLKKEIGHKKALGHLLIPDSIAGLYPKEKPSYHKYQRGQVLGLASSSSYRGASYLYTKAAYKVGAGLVRLFHEKGSLFFNDLAPEVTQHEVDDIDKFLDKQKIAAVFGPGLMINSAHIQIVSKFLEKHIPCVIDSGALESLNLSKLHPHVVLTPHIDELKRLLKITTDDFDEMVKLSSNHLLQSGLTLVIKGHHSWILHQDKKPLIAAFAPLAMATAGSGDVLAGMIGGFLSKGIDSLTATLLGVGLHSLAGMIAIQNQSPKAIMASDILEAIAEALNDSA